MRNAEKKKYIYTVPKRANTQTPGGGICYTWRESDRETLLGPTERERVFESSLAPGSWVSLSAGFQQVPP